MTFNRFKQICEDHGLNVIVLPTSNNTYARAFFNTDVVAVYDKKRMYCYNSPIAFRYAAGMLIDTGECTEVYSTTELEENIVQTIGILKKLFIEIKKYEIEKDFK